MWKHTDDHALRAPDRDANRLLPTPALRLGLELAGLLVVVSIAAILRFWEVDARPGYEYDEPVYASIARSLASTGALVAPTQAGEPAIPYLYHPPFYFFLLAGWFELVGPGIEQARLFAASASLAVLAGLYLFLRHSMGMAALVPMLVVATDGWLVYSNRIGWMDNTLLVLVVVAMLAYRRALNAERMWPFVLAGICAGLAIVFKHVGAYVLVAIAINWAIIGRRRSHVALMGSAGLVVVAYFVGMVVAYQDGSRNLYLEATGVQIARSLGWMESTSSITGFTDLIVPILNQYSIFYSTLVVALVGTAAIVIRAAIGVIRRRRSALRRNSILLSWAAGAMLFFAAVQLKFPQYYMHVLVPIYLFLAKEVWDWVRQQFVVAPSMRSPGRIPVFALTGVTVGVMVLANALTFEQRIGERTDNALLAVSRYAAEEVPSDDLVLTYEPIGALIEQPYCEIWRVHACADDARHIVVYESTLMERPSNAAFVELVRSARKGPTFVGFKERISVYHVDRSDRTGSAHQVGG